LTIAGNPGKLPVHTLQKFPVIAREIGELPGKRFAVIVDEAPAELRRMISGNRRRCRSPRGFGPLTREGSTKQNHGVEFKSTTDSERKAAFQPYPSHI
jgi:hypothetical protein